MKAADIFVPLRSWSADDVAAAVEASPSALCADSAELAVLQALEPCATFGELLVKLYPTHTGNLAGAGRLAERMADTKSWTIEGGAIDLDQSTTPRRGHVGVVGDLQITGNLQVVAALVVTGDLRVDGTLSDCGPQSRIVVLGELHCRHVDTSGWVTVVGDVHVEGVLFGSYNDDAFETHGSITCGALVSDEHGFEAKQGYKPRHVPSQRGVWGSDIFDVRNSEHIATLRHLLGADVINDQDELVWDKLPTNF